MLKTKICSKQDMLEVTYAKKTYSQHTKFAQNHICSKQHLLKTMFSQNNICQKQHFLKTTLAQNNICSKQHLLKTTFSQNNIFSKQYWLITTITQNNICSINICSKQHLLKITLLNTKFNKTYSQTNGKTTKADRVYNVLLSYTKVPLGSNIFQLSFIIVPLSPENIQRSSDNVQLSLLNDSVVLTMSNLVFKMFH